MRAILHRKGWWGNIENVFASAQFSIDHPTIG
jgi:hypothetical protein